MEQDPRVDIRDYFIIAIMGILFGIIHFNYNWWIIIKIPLLVSGLMLVNAIGLYFIRKD